MGQMKQSEVDQLTAQELREIAAIACNLEHFTFPDSALGVGKDVAFVRRAEIERLEARCLGALARVQQSSDATPVGEYVPRAGRKTKRGYQTSEAKILAYGLFDEGFTNKQVLDAIHNAGLLTRRETVYRLPNVCGFRSQWKQERQPDEPTT